MYDARAGGACGGTPPPQKSIPPTVSQEIGLSVPSSVLKLPNGVTCRAMWCGSASVSNWDCMASHRKRELLNRYTVKRNNFGVPESAFVGRIRSQSAPQLRRNGRWTCGGAGMREATATATLSASLPKAETRACKCTHRRRTALPKLETRNRLQPHVWL
jgi:hypothetical protein